jgi:hypothetical protein
MRIDGFVVGRLRTLRGHTQTSNRDFETNNSSARWVHSRTCRAVVPFLHALIHTTQTATHDPRRTIRSGVAGKQPHFPNTDRLLTMRPRIESDSTRPNCRDWLSQSVNTNLYWLFEFPSGLRSTTTTSGRPGFPQLWPPIHVARGSRCSVPFPARDVTNRKNQCSPAATFVRDAGELRGTKTTPALKEHEGLNSFNQPFVGIHSFQTERIRLPRGLCHQLCFLSIRQHTYGAGF